MILSFCFLLWSTIWLYEFMCALILIARLPIFILKGLENRCVLYHISGFLWRNGHLHFVNPVRSCACEVSLSSSIFFNIFIHYFRRVNCMGLSFFCLFLFWVLYSYVFILVLSLLWIEFLSQFPFNSAALWYTRRLM